MSCGIVNCPFDKFTPGGSRNFACKYWIDPIHHLQDEISEELQDYDDSDYESSLGDPDFLEDLIVERNNFFPDIKSLFQHSIIDLSNQSYDEAIKSTSSPETQKRISDAFVKINQIHAEPIPKNQNQSQNHSDRSDHRNELFKRLDDIPYISDTRSQQVLKRHAESLTLLFKSVFPELDRSNEEEEFFFKPEKKDLSPLEEKKISPVKEKLDSNFLELFYDTFSVIEKVIKLLDVLVVQTKPEAFNHLGYTSGLIEALPKQFQKFKDSEKFVKFFKKSKSLALKRLTSESEKDLIFFVCNDKDEISRLVRHYPNLFFLSDKFEFQNKFNFKEIMSTYNYDKPMIILINSLETIPDSVYLDDQTTVIELDTSVDRFFFIKENHVIFPRYLLYELELFKLFQSERNKTRYKLKYFKYKDLFYKNKVSHHLFDEID